MYDFNLSQNDFFIEPQNRHAYVLKNCRNFANFFSLLCIRSYTYCIFKRFRPIDLTFTYLIPFPCLQWARPRVYLHEATLRMMAGAAPNRTQQLLDRSLIQKSSSRGLICGKGKSIFIFWAINLSFKHISSLHTIKCVIKSAKVWRLHIKRTRSS